MNPQQLMKQAQQMQERMQKQMSGLFGGLKIPGMF